MDACVAGGEESSHAEASNTSFTLDHQTVISADAAQQKVEPEASVPPVTEIHAVDGDAPSEALEAGAAKRLQITSKDFVKLPLDKLKAWVSKASPVPLLDVFKQRHWGFAFVTISASDANRFRESVHGSCFKTDLVTVNDAHAQEPGKRPRDADGGEAPKPKKQKSNDGSAADRVPTLLDLKNKAKQKKGKNGESVLVKSSPLVQWPYETQVSMKDGYAKTALRHLLKHVKNACQDLELALPAWTCIDWLKSSGALNGCACPLITPLGCPIEGLDGYRNKCEFSIAHNEAGEIDVGFVLRVTEQGAVIAGECSEVPSVPEQMKRLCALVRDCVRNSDFPVLDRRQKERPEGSWRLLTARMTPTGEMLVMMQTTTTTEGKKQQMLDLLIKTLVPADLRIVSIYLQFNDDLTDAVKPGAPLMHIHGQATLCMPLLGSNFALGPLNFWNPNTATNNALYQQAIDWLSLDSNTIVLDVCCGMGTYAILCCVRGCKEAIGVDVSNEDIVSARENAAANGVSNAVFRVGKIEDVLPAVLGDLAPDVKVYAVIDPPRPGVHHRAISAMKRCEGLKRIVYVSCNPDSLAEDVAKLCTPDEMNPFVPVRAVTVDTFPHTLQFEMVMQLDRANDVPDPRATTTAAGRADNEQPVATIMPAEPAGEIEMQKTMD